MATRHISFTIHGGPAAEAALARTAVLRSHKLREMTTNIGHVALYWMRIYAPIGETMYLMRHLDISPLTWRPGGAGGGGTWEMVTGVKRGSSEHPLYVHEGTGIYGPKKKLITAKGYRRYSSVSDMRDAIDRVSNARPGENLPVMTFQKHGEPRRFRPYTRGQAPQPYVRLAYLQARLYAVSRTQGFFAGI
jgi:hypothetical protein